MVDSRHEKRIHIVQNLFATSFQKESKVKLPHRNLRDVTDEILQNKVSIDEHIKRHAPKYPLDKIARTDLGILRLAVYELTIAKKEPTKVIINEAVELAKELGNERSYAFVNAVLGSIVKDTQ